MWCCDSKFPYFRLSFLIGAKRKIKMRTFEFDFQSRKTSTLHIKCIAYDMRYTFASDIGMAFELAIEDLIPGQEPMTFKIGLDGHLHKENLCRSNLA